MGPETQHQIRLTPFATPLVLQTTADKLFYSFIVPTKLLRAACTITTQNTVTAAILSFDRRVTYGSDTGRVVAKTLTMPIAAIIGKVVYSLPINVTFQPGEQLVVALTQASTAGAAHVDIWIEPAWEEPLNLAAGIQSV
jgi:hypothetical protein